MCGAAGGCKYDVITASNYRCCHLPSSPKHICAGYTDAELVKEIDFPIVVPKIADQCTSSSPCCSNEASINDDKEEAGEMSAGLCKLMVGGCMSPKTVDYICTSQISAGTKCVQKPEC